MIVGWWLLMLLSGIFAAFLDGSLPPELAEYNTKLATRESTVGDWVFITFGFALILLVAIASVGLWLFKRLGRTLFLVANLLSFAGYFGNDVPVVLVWADIVSYLSSLLLGGILFTMYLPPISEHFELSDQG